MKKIIVGAVGLMLCLQTFAQAKEIYKDKNKPIETRVQDLMSKMTLEEKLGQLNLPSDGDIITGLGSNSGIVEKIKKGLVGGMFNIKGVDKIKSIQEVAVKESRLGIPLLFGMDVIHGYETVFPIPLGLSCSWDMDLIERSAQIAASEASADGINWTFSPMVDISRDPRWGRVSEGNGEDPFLGGQIAKAMVYGYQGRDQLFASDKQIAACVKHFALYGASEAGRDYNTVDMSRINMFNYYLKPYQDAVDAGVVSVMAAFNVVDGVPSHGNKWLLTDVLRDRWNFKGFVVADYGGISEMMSHGLGDYQTVSALALNAGLDMDMVSEGFLNTLSQSLTERKITEDKINAACAYILTVKFQLGLMDDPYKFCNLKRAKKDIYTASNRDEARKTAADSFVLLKNDNQTLPLSSNKKIALVGPLANTRSNMVGTWSVAANLETPATLLEAMQTAFGKANVTYAKGSNLTEDAKEEENATLFGRSLNRDQRSNSQLREEALAIAKDVDVIVAAIGESSEMSGESSSRSSIGIPTIQQELLAELLKTGKPVVLVLFTGRPLTLEWENENVPAILNVWFGGSEAADAISDVLLGKVVPSGKLTTTFPRNVGQIPLYYNHLNTGRPVPEDSEFKKYASNYLDVKNSPLYPFGYGLSYTTFDYSNIQLSKKNGKDYVSISVKNTGSYEAKETVQMYIRDLAATIARPVKELKGFEKISLKSGETKTVTFEIAPELLKYYNNDLNFVLDPGKFEIMVGPNSRDLSKVEYTL